jgi:hypothetical protein
MADMTLQDLLAQFGATEQDRDAARRQAALVGGLLALTTRKGEVPLGLARAGLGAVAARDNYLGGIMPGKIAALEGASKAMSLQQQLAGLRTRQGLQKNLGDVFSAGPNLNAMGPGGPTPQNAAAIAPPSEVQKYRQAAALLAAQGDSEGAKRYSDIANSMEVEFNPTPQTLKDPSGALKSVLIGKRGDTKTLPFLPAEKLHFSDTGNLAGVGQNVFTGATEFAGLPKTMDPAQIANNEVQLAHLKLARNADARAAAAEGGGRPKWDTATGQFVYEPSPSNPVGRAVSPEGYVKPAKNAPEAYTKQIGGIINVGTAIDNYLAELKTWSNADLANPAKRAQIGTAYNNTMLQLKEAYNLGVLNGPDFQILTTTLTDPLSMKGTLTPNSAIEDQSKQLRQVLARNAANLARVYKQEPPNIDELLGGSKGGGNNVVDSLPATAPKGTRARDTKTGKILTFDGTKWSE